MGLIVCFCCGRQREIKPIKRDKSYFCSNCGATKVKIVRSRAHAGYISWTDKEGGDAEKARHDTYAGLRGYAERRQYKKAKGWCANKFKQIFGRWPNGEAAESSAPASSGLLWWIKKGNSDYAKQQRELEGRGLANMGDRVWVRSADSVDAASPLMTDDDWGVKL